MENEKFTDKKEEQAPGITPQMLQRYEKEGFLSVRRDDAGRMDQYGQLDLRTALHARLYRSMGFSADETRQLLREFDIREIHETLEQRLEQLEQERIHLERTERALREWTRGVEEARAKTGRCWFEKISGSCFAVLKNGSRSQLGGSRDTEELLTLLKGQLPFARQVFFVPREVLSDPSLEYEDFYGMMAEERWAEELGLAKPLADYHMSYEGMAAVTILRMEAEGIGRQAFEPFLAYIEKRGYEPAGSMLGTVLAAEFDGQGYIGYFKFYLPVRERTAV